MAGGDLTITIVEGDYFVNSAKVITPNVLVAGGVVHVIDNVLNPNNTDDAPQPTAEVQSAAFEGASSVASLGSLTSGVPTPTNAADFGAAPTPADSQETPAGGEGAAETGTPGAAPRVEGAMAAAALFAGAGVWLNA